MAKFNGLPYFLKAFSMLLALYLFLKLDLPMPLEKKSS